MTAAAVLAELTRRGARVDRVGDRLRIVPGRVVEPELLEVVRAHKPALLRLVPAAPEGLTDAPREALGTLPAPAREPEAPLYPLRVVVAERRPVTGPVELSPGVVAFDVPKATEALLGDLHRAVLTYAETCRDGGDDRLHRLAVEAGEEIEQAIEDLARLGVRVRVEAVQ